MERGWGVAERTGGVGVRLKGLEACRAQHERGTRVMCGRRCSDDTLFFAPLQRRRVGRGVPGGWRSRENKLTQCTHNSLANTKFLRKHRMPYHGGMYWQPVARLLLGPPCSLSEQRRVRRCTQEAAMKNETASVFTATLTNSKEADKRGKRENAPAAAQRQRHVQHVPTRLVCGHFHE